MRRKFEFGEITWQEFWHHRAWLIEHQHELFNDSAAYVCYIHPSQMVPRKKFYFERYNHLSPMALKLQELEDRSTVDYYIGDNMEELAIKLIEFRKKYPEIVSPNILKPKAA